METAKIGDYIGGIEEHSTWGQIIGESIDKDKTRWILDTRRTAIKTNEHVKWFVIKDLIVIKNYKMQKLFKKYTHLNTKYNIADISLRKLLSNNHHQMSEDEKKRLVIRMSLLHEIARKDIIDCLHEINEVTDYYVY